MLTPNTSQRGLQRTIYWNREYNAWISARAFNSIFSVEKGRSFCLLKIFQISVFLFFISSRIKLFTVNSQYNKLERIGNRRRNTNLYEVLSTVSFPPAWFNLCAVKIIRFHYYNVYSVILSFFICGEGTDLKHLRQIFLCFAIISGNKKPFVVWTIFSHSKISAEVSLNLPARKLVWRRTIFCQATKSLIPILESHPSSVHLISRTWPNKISRQLIDTLVIWKISPVSEVTVPLRPEASQAGFPGFF